jgi:prevent-host-death family protein
MKTTHISLTEAKQRLGELVKRSAYGGEQFVIEFRGKPQAMVVTYNADYEEDAERRRARGLEALKRLDEIRERIRDKSGTLPSSVELIRDMREERDRQILGLP